MNHLDLPTAQPCSRPALLFASSNPTKKMIYQPILSDMGLTVVGLAEADGIRPDKPVENALTVTANAVIKARHYHCNEHPHVFAHDVGICFDALNDEPGVQARRWAGKLADDVDDQTWMDYLLMRMKDVPNAQRTGRFVVGWALATADGQMHSRTLESPFTLAHAPLRPMTPGSPMTALVHGEQDMIRQRQAHFAAQLRQWVPLQQLANSVR